ncbi:MAG: 23S rRNA methyltransferase [Gammaproteobacteria bacterium]|nr:23S rRNA methyltransferase [Gammaproteobacteria bacterium]
MSKNSSSARWKARQARDPFVKRAQAEGWRSRAVFKLSELQGRERLLKPGSVVVDLGAAPGAWSQFAAGVAGAQGLVLAVDLLPMANLAGVEIFQGDFREAATVNVLLSRLAGRPVDLVLSDMAPNMTGTRVVDQPRTMHLAELASDFAGQVLRPGGALVVKLFQGEGFQEYVESTRSQFASVRMRKPAASRSGNRETYLVARNFRL